MLYAKFGWNWPSGSVEVDENVKKFTDRRTDDERQAIKKKLTSAFSSGELKIDWKSTLETYRPYDLRHQWQPNTDQQ